MIMVSHSLDKNTRTGLVISLLFKYKSFGQSDLPESPQILDICGTIEAECNLTIFWHELFANMIIACDSGETFVIFIFKVVFFINSSCTKPKTHTLHRGGGGGVGRTPATSKTLAPMNLKFCRVLETSFNILEILKLFT